LDHEVETLHINGQFIQVAHLHSEPPTPVNRLFLPDNYPATGAKMLHKEGGQSEQHQPFQA